MSTDTIPHEGMEVIVPSISDATFKYTWQIKKYAKLKANQDSFDSAPFECSGNGDTTQWNLSIRYWKGKEGKRLDNPVVLCLNLLSSTVRRAGQATVSFELGVYNVKNQQWDICPRSRTVLYLPSSTDILSVGYRDLHIRKHHQAHGTGNLTIFVKIHLNFTEEVKELGNNLFDDMAKLLEEAPDTGDVTLECAQGTQIRAHSHILAARSPVLRELLTNGNRVDLANLSEEAVRQMLLYIYTDRVDEIESSATVLISNAHRFLLPGLKQRCEQYLCETITTPSVPSLLLVADQFNCETLKKAVMTYCEGHAGVIQKNMTWKVLEMVNPELFEEACEAGLGSSVSSNMDSLPSDPDESN